MSLSVTRRVLRLSHLTLLINRPQPSTVLLKCISGSQQPPSRSVVPPHCQLPRDLRPCAPRASLSIDTPFKFITGLGTIARLTWPSGSTTVTGSSWPLAGERSNSKIPSRVGFPDHMCAVSLSVNAVGINPPGGGSKRSSPGNLNSSTLATRAQLISWEV